MPGDFTDHQWQRLVDAGPQIALAVAASAGSAGQSEAELGAFLRLVDETADSDTGTLLGQLAAASRDKVASGLLTGNSDDAIPDGINAAREAGAILAVVADEEDARSIRQWLLQVAHTTAAAAREGGVLGIGGTEVSDDERDTMAGIADGLGGSAEADVEEPTDAPARPPPTHRRPKAKLDPTGSRSVPRTSAREPSAGPWAGRTKRRAKARAASRSGG